MITQSSVEKFLDDLASGHPTPGGGSAAAIMGAMGAALVSMVCNVTIGKKGYEGVEAEMKAVLHESEKVRRRLTDMVAEDIAAFDSILTAYKLPKATTTRHGAPMPSRQACVAQPKRLWTAHAYVPKSSRCRGEPASTAISMSSATAESAYWQGSRVCAARP